MAPVTTNKKRATNRLVSPLMALEKRFSSFSATGATHGSFTHKGHTVTVCLETDNCLSLRLPLNAISGESDFTDGDLIRIHHWMNGPAKFARDGETASIISEMWVAEKADVRGAFRAARMSVGDAIALYAGKIPHNRKTEPPPASADNVSLVEQALKDLGLNALRKNDRFSVSFDTRKHLHRINIMVASSEKGGATVRIEAAGERLPSLSATAAEAIGAFVMEANAKTRFARFSLVDTAENESGPSPITEFVTPLELFEINRIRAILEALIVGADRIRDEVVALGREDMAQIYLEVMKKKSMVPNPDGA